MKKFNAFPLRLGTRQGRLLSLLLFNITVEVCANAIREEKETKVMHIEKEDIKLPHDYLCRKSETIETNKPTWN